MVCHATAMIGRENYLGSQIQKLSVCTSLGIGLASFFFRENTFSFLYCMGKMEWFIFDLKKPFQPFAGGYGIKLPFFNPFRLSVNAVGFAFIFVVPILYYKIFKFRKKQDTSTKGVGN